MPTLPLLSATEWELAYHVKALNVYRALKKLLETF